MASHISSPTTQVLFAAQLEKEMGGPVVCTGKDGEGERVSVSKLWSSLLTSATAVDKWYRNGADYWEGTTADDDGVLGGLSHVNDKESRESLAFLDELASRFSMVPDRALDCGAGIGRVTLHTLGKRFSTIDLVEQDRALLDEARRKLNCEHLPILGLSEDKTKWKMLDAPREPIPPPSVAAGKTIAGDIGELYCCGLQEFSFVAREREGSEAISSAPVYSCIWLQWVVGCLLDVDLVRLLRGAGKALGKEGCIVIKDNALLSPSSFFTYDSDDESICRSEAYLLRLVEMAGLEVILRREQIDWESDLLPVVAYALRPTAGSSSLTAATS